MVKAHGRTNIKQHGAIGRDTVLLHRRSGGGYDFISHQKPVRILFSGSLWPVCNAESKYLILARLEEFEADAQQNKPEFSNTLQPDAEWIIRIMIYHPKQQCIHAMGYLCWSAMLV